MAKKELSVGGFATTFGLAGDCVQMKRAPNECVSDYVARFEGAVGALGVCLQPDERSPGVTEGVMVVFMELLRSGLLMSDLEIRLARAMKMLKSCGSSWDDFTGLLRAQADDAWTVAPPPKRGGGGGGSKPYARERRARNGDISAEERRERRERGLCFKCGEPGIARECPNHGARPSGNGGAGGGQ